MKTIGVRTPRRFSSCSRSGPDILGIAISRIRHLASRTQSDARNSSAESNALAAKPNSFSKSGNDPRTDSSSSMTATSERLNIPRFPRDAVLEACVWRQYRARKFVPLQPHAKMWRPTSLRLCSTFSRRRQIIGAFFIFRLAHLHLLGPEVDDTLVSVVDGRWAPNAPATCASVECFRVRTSNKVGQASRLATVKRRHRADQCQGVGDTIVQWIHVHA